MFQVVLVEKDNGFEVELPTIKRVYSIIHKIKSKYYDASTKRWYIKPDSIAEFINSIDTIANVNVYYKNSNN